MVSFGKPDIEKLKQKIDSKGLIKALNYQDPNVAWAAMVALIEFGHIVPRKALKAKMEKTKDKEYSRLFAAIALGNLGDKAAIPTLNKGLNSPIEVFSKFSALTLGILGSPSAEAKLTAILNSSYEDIAIRESSAEGLFCIGTENALITLASKRSQLIKEGDISQSCLFSKCSQLLKAVDSGRILEIFRPKLLNEFSSLAANTLNFRGWKPVEDREKFIYYAVIKNWAECAKSGASTISELFSSQSDSKARRIIIEACLKSNISGKADVFVTMLNDSDFDNRKVVSDELVSMGESIVISISNKLNNSSKSFREASKDVFVRIGKPAIIPLGDAIPGMDYEALDCVFRALTVICENNLDCQAYTNIAMFLPDNLPDDDKADLYLTVADLSRIIGLEITDVAAKLKVLKSLESCLAHKKIPEKGVIVNTLDTMGWKPSSNSASAYYWISKGRYDHCIEIGEPAVEPLIDTMSSCVSVGLISAAGQIEDSRFVIPLINCLKSGRKDVRKEAATVLVALYHSGKLHEYQKKKIIEQRKTITNHTDLPSGNHSDYHSDGSSRSSDCTHSETSNSYSHQDDGGIGIDFPL